MVKHRVRIRFSKESDLRLIGHRDLVRTPERLFRRAGLALRMIEGFHPRPKMSFPSALPVGIVGVSEVMELELVHAVETESLAETLNQHAPPGLLIRSVLILGANQPKGQADGLVYEFPVPDERRADTVAAIDRLWSCDSCQVQRDGKKEPVDIRVGLERLDLVDGVLQIQQRVIRTASARPCDVLKVLGLDDLESQGNWLTRAVGELTP